MHFPPDLPPTAHAPSRWLQLREWVLSSRLAFSLLVVSAMLLFLWWWRPLILLPGTQPLVMPGGDPYLRALMRTISASESNVLRPYNVIYGSTFVWTLDNHPNRCESINRGPNKGNCSTAAGRYQLLNSTWTGLATRYHPERIPGAKEGDKLSFAPIFQDQVVYQWLADNKVWRVDLSAQLRQGKTRAVLRRLSGTWTSLGYGIESNSMSADLPNIYKRVLADELEHAASDEKN